MNSDEAFLHQLRILQQHNYVQYCIDLEAKALPSAALPPYAYAAQMEEFKYRDSITVQELRKLDELINQYN